MGDFCRNRPQIGIGARGGFFHHHHAAHQLGNIGNFLLGNMEIFHCPQGVDAPINISGNLALAEQIGFDTFFHVLFPVYPQRIFKEVWEARGK